MAISLYFAILDHPLKSPFPIAIPEDGIEIDGIKHRLDQISFGDLKKLIHKRKPNICAENEVDDLKLWRVEDISDGNKVWKNLELMLKARPPMTEIIEKIKGEIFPANIPVKGSPLLIANGIIIVQPPPPATTGKCLPMVYLSNKKFALSHNFFYSIRQKESGRFGRGK